MVAKYELGRATEELGRSIVSDVGGTGVYVYLKFSDRVDVYKFSNETVMASMDSASLISVSAPVYRVQGGACSCEGYKYRSNCRHAQHVREMG